MIYVTETKGISSLVLGQVSWIRFLGSLMFDRLLGDLKQSSI